ncbi:MAG: hypothetical protein FJZ16_02560 [Candidatus Omnitrophica bacterium]|nr:hypothetical protein [Candidatus Omnitrophota bacterium]
MYRYLKALPSFLVLILISGCARYSIGYNIKPSTSLCSLSKTVAVELFSDERPTEERKGLTNEFLSFSSMDSHFDKEVRVAICELLSEELNSGGIKSFIIKDIDDLAEFDYILRGKILHFQTIIKPSKTTLVPYLGAVSTIWARDEFLTLVTIYAELLDRNNDSIFRKTFNISEGIELKTGILNVGRLSRGLNYKLKLLNIALSDVLKQIKQDVLNNIKKDVRGS